MKTRTVGIILFFVGITYMAVDGWLLSWWLVPDYRQIGPAFISDISFYSSRSFFTFWALSIPLGSLITAFGLALYVRLEKVRLLIFIFGSLLFLIWLGLWSQSVLYPVLYGICGGLILLSFSMAIWSLANTRMHSDGVTKNVLDLRGISYIFFVITAWGMCGLLGIPSFGLHPEQLLEYESYSILISMGAKVVICFTLGWIFLAASHYLEYLKQKRVA